MIIPLTVPSQAHKTYHESYNAITHGTDRLLLFAGDQKIEHLNNDFFGNDIPRENNNPQHLFSIAEQADIGAFATHLGLISRLGHGRKKIQYIVKLNGKTNLSSGEPLSKTLHSVQDVVEFKKQTDLSIAGIGYTIYLGSKHESSMLAAAAQHIYHAHRHGLITILWLYPRGGTVQKQTDSNIIAGAAGVGAALGADFVKIHLPDGETPAEQAQALRQAVGAAGNTGVLCAGGEKMNSENLITSVQAQISIAGARGIAIGRNIHQRPLTEAIELCNTLSKLIYAKTSKKYSFKST